MTRAEKVMHARAANAGMTGPTVRRLIAMRPIAGRVSIEAGRNALGRAHASTCGLFGSAAGSLLLNGRLRRVSGRTASEPVQICCQKLKRR